MHGSILKSGHGHRALARFGLPARLLGTPAFLAGLACLCACFCFCDSAHAQAEPQSQEPPSQSGALQVLQSFEQVLVDVIANREDSVVAIARVRKSEAQVIDPTDPDFVPNEYATGVVVGAEGLILTNFHLMREDSEYWITTSARAVHKVQDWWGDERLDLAVLKVNAEELKPMEFGDAEQLRKGKIVIALGNPYAIARDGQVSASWGIISNLSRKPPAEPTREPEAPFMLPPGQSGGPLNLKPDKPTIHHYGTLIHTDVRLDRGTSGGALLDLNGRMIGLTTAMADHVGFEKSTGYAIALDEQMLGHIETLKRGDEIELGYFGVHVEDRPDAMRVGMPGVRVRSPVFGTPAHQCGLQADDLILAVDQTPIFDKDALFLEFRKRSVNDKVRILYERDGVRQELTATLEKAPPSGRRRYVERPAWRGLRVDHASVLIQSGFGRGAEASRGVGIIEVERESPAWQAGLRVGMIITAVGSVPVSHPAELREMLPRQNGDVVLTVDAPAGDEAGRVTIQE